MGREVLLEGERLFRMARSGREGLPEKRERSGGMGRVGSPSWMAGKGWEALLKGARRVSRPSQRARMGREALPEGWKGLGVSPGKPEG